MDSCIFCKIIKKQIPSFTVFEDENYLAFLDINPIKKGHTMVIPKKHHDYFFDLEDEQMANLIKTAKKVSALLKKTFEPKSGKIGVMIYGLDVPHTHIHLIPIDRPGELTFANAKPAKADDLKEVLDQIKSSR